MRTHRPNGRRLWTANDVARWIKANVPLENRGADGDQPMQNALWWHAFNEASGFCDFRQKDFASMLVEGIKPLKERDLSEALREWAERTGCEAQTHEEVDAAIEADLREFFGVGGAHG